MLVGSIDSQVLNLSPMQHFTHDRKCRSDYSEESCVTENRPNNTFTIDVSGKRRRQRQRARDWEETDGIYTKATWTLVALRSHGRQRPVEDAKLISVDASEICMAQKGKWEQVSQETDGIQKDQEQAKTSLGTLDWSMQGDDIAETARFAGGFLRIEPNHVLTHAARRLNAEEATQRDCCERVERRMLAVFGWHDGISHPNIVVAIQLLGRQFVLVRMAGSQAQAP